ncbi:MAG: uroporphyrinogen-III C-methyltransferase [Desulfotomaculales bacterium]
MRGGCVYLIGAGPGDPGLLTIKGLDCLQKADVVVYDRLVNPYLLKYTRADAELVYAGKSPEGHTLSQAEINELLAVRAKAGKIVARLKGGDPFIFGRGGEEAEYLAARGVPFEVVPGVTAAAAVPAYAGIPLTHRAYTSSLAVVTGNEDPLKDDTSIAWDKLSTGAGTLVFLMGVANLPGIVARLLANGRDRETPAAVIQWGTLPLQVTVTGTLADIGAKVARAGITNPAVFVVGDVVRLREKLNWFEAKPLFGKKVLITRTREQAGELAKAITALGGEPWEFPTIQILPPVDWTPVDVAIEHLGAYDWIIFTSVNGVRFFFGRLKQHDKDVRALGRACIGAIGPKTQAALERYGLRVDAVPELYRAEEVAATLRERMAPGAKVLLPRADIARKLLAEALAELGAEVTEVAVYRTVPVAKDAAPVRRALDRGEIDVVTFTSSSTVHNFVSLVGPGEAAALLAGCVVASIGPITSRTARAYGIRVDVEAERYTIDGLVEAICGYFGGG